MSKAVRRPRGKKTSKRTSRSSGSSREPLAFREAMAAAARALRGREWFLFGAQAVALHGFPRVTADIDITVASEAPHELVAALKREGFRLADIGDVDSFVAATRVLPFVHRNGIGLDLALSGPGIEEAMHARALSRRLGSVVVRLIEINDLLTLKLLAGRPKDLEDVRALVRIRPDGLDRSKVVANLRSLEQALDISDLVPRVDDLWPC